MWRYLPPAVLMACSALVLIAGATGDLQFWSQSMDSLPSWRSVVGSEPWSPVTGIVDSGMAWFRHRQAAPAVSATTGTAASPAAVPAAAASPAQRPAPATQPTPDRQSSAAQPSLLPAKAAMAAAALAATPPAQEQANTPMQEHLLHAREALAAGRAAEARKMLESVRAEMALRPLRESNAAQFDMSGTWLDHALLSLKSGDSTGALHDLDLAINSS